MKIESAELNTTAVRVSQYPTDNKCEFLLVGRSNVGKSSFINSLINRKNYEETNYMVRAYHGMDAMCL